MEKIVIGIIAAAVGFALIIFRGKFVEAIVKANNEEGLGFRHYGTRDKELGLKLAPLFGVLFIVLGALILVGVIEFK